MPDHERAMLAYCKLAELSQEKRQLPGRDKFLVLAGAGLITRVGGGLYWVAPATIEAFVGGLATVWILLVEIRR